MGLLSRRLQAQPVANPCIRGVHRNPSSTSRAERRQVTNLRELTKTGSIAQDIALIQFSLLSTHRISCSVNLEKIEKISGSRSGSKGNLERRTRSANLSTEFGMPRSLRTFSNVSVL